MSVTINAGTSGSSHVHNPATTDTLGMVKVGDHLNISAGSLSINSTIARTADMISEDEIQRQIHNRVYQGVDLTVKFASEIATKSDAWAWIKSRITAGNYAGLNIGDYIPIILNGKTVWPQIAGIDTYRKTGDIEIGRHIDFISKDCMEPTYQWNTTNINNGTSVNPAPYMVSALKASLDGLVTSLPAALQAVIIEKRMLIETRYAAGSTLTDSTGWAWNDIGKLWVPSEIEVYGAIVWSTRNGWSQGNSACYPIFANNWVNRVKGIGHLGARSSWWLSLASGGNSSRCCFVAGNGHSLNYDTSYALMAPLCFRIGG